MTANMSVVESNKSSSDKAAVDVLLLQRVAKRDRGAFEELFEIYHPRLFSFLFRLTSSHSAAEELANDVLLTLWKDAGRFRGASKVSTWIFGIAYRQALAHLRKHRFQARSIRDEDAMVSAGDARLEREDWVRQGIDTLPAKQKLTVMLVYFLGLTCEETATASGVPVSTVKTRMFHARKNLKEYLTASGIPEDRRKEFLNE
ncbi:MAG TPA: sigma-70 family RNA polymerase sigma factor [Woeseiaceae bacterium]|nr:sigma-70 family RNA polymerase sigma factor [Woeseiaceae bacterium]